MIKYWIESSYCYEDKKREYDEELIIAVNYGEEGTESIATFNINQRGYLEDLINHVNRNIKYETLYKQRRNKWRKK